MATNVDRIVQDVWVRRVVGGIGCHLKVLRGAQLSIWDDKLYKAEGAIKPQRILAIKMRGIGDGFEWASECAWFERRWGKNSILGLSLRPDELVVCSLVLGG